MQAVAVVRLLLILLFVSSLLQFCYTPHLVAAICLVLMFMNVHDAAGTFPCQRHSHV